MTSEFWSAFDKAAPQYLRLARDLAEEINRGVYAVNSLMPTEAELCQRYEVSRHTVRAALKEMQTAGLITSRQGVGTKVIATEPAAHFRATWPDHTQIIAPAVEAHTRFLARTEVVCDAALAQRLSCRQDRPLTRIDFLSLPADDPALPCGLHHVYVDPEVFRSKGIGTADEAEIIRQVEKYFGDAVHSVDIRFHPATLDADQCRLLERTQGDIALCVRRNYSLASYRDAAISEAFRAGNHASFGLSVTREVKAR